ncbi:RING-type E3 ubiquitin transferase [Heracleum sosnowskyi]|uniref:RING-type E3 ubiquitin transferase n=1 Tax=Heracleum sosnowskyi TaxID=360622 RepID=A0AAD8JL10_9APIA|nr:RING-type E3 ubiquitin transferase [Heracleum sosnowskyi]
MGNGAKQRWRFSFHWSPTHTKKPQHQKHLPPKEFLCPITRTLMYDPVIVSSGHTFDRNSIEACLSLSFSPTLPDGSVPDFTNIIPNLALKSTILNYIMSSSFRSKPLDSQSVIELVKEMKLKISTTTIASELTRWPSHLSSTSSLESVTPTTPLPLTTTTRPSCYSSSSSSDVETLTPNPTSEHNENGIIAKIKSSLVHEQEEGVVSLRNITRIGESARADLCTPQLLSGIRSLITSKYASVQVNCVAALVNLSLEKTNKVKIVRAGIVPPLIDVLRGGFPEAQEHAAGALFSLSLDDQNKTAIGVLGALQPLVHALRSDSSRARSDSTLALYHLTLVESNRVKLVKLGGVVVLLDMVGSGYMSARVLLVLGNLAASVEGRAAMLNGGAVGCFVDMLKRDEFDSELTRESCVAALYGLSFGGLRFKGLAKEAGVEEVLQNVEERGTARAKAKARRILAFMRVKYEEEGEEETVDWEELLNSEEASRTHL